MKHCLLCLLLCASFASKAQTAPAADSPNYFAQCMLHIEDEQLFRQLETDLRAHPHVSVVRLDWYSKRAFLLTKDLTAFTPEQFASWLGEQAEKATCIQVGLHGIDPVNPYPFTNCEN